MIRWKRALALFLFLLLLLPPCAAFADGEKDDAPPAQEDALTSRAADQEAEGKSARVNVAAEEGLRQQIQATYTAAKKRARRKSFKGYCGAYVANQLMALGINTSYLSANGNNTFELYRDLEITSGGYYISAYRAREYTLEEALQAILRKEPAATNILVGFQKGVSSAAKKYGHVLFIHGIRNGKVFYSDSCSRTVDDVKYKEGEPIVCSLESFVNLYAKYKLDLPMLKKVRESGQRGLILRKSAETPAGKEKRDASCPGGGQVLGGVAHIDRPPDTVPCKEQGDVLPLVEARPARGLVIVEQGRKPVGMEKGLGVLLRAVADETDEIALVEKPKRLPHLGIEAGAPLKEIGRLRVQASVRQGVSLPRRQVGELRVADLPGRQAHEP